MTRPIVFLKKTDNNQQSPSIPIYSTPGASGADLFAAQKIILKPFQPVAVATGIALEIPQGYEGQVRPRSGLALKHGITVLNAPGTIDWDFRGEIKVIVCNTGAKDFVVEQGMRIAQLVIAPVVQCDFQEKEDLSSSHRGEGGFGSTGL